MQSDFRARLLDVTRARLSPDLRRQFDFLDPDVQDDIAVTLLWTTQLLPARFGPQHIDILKPLVRAAITALDPSGEGG